jgi:hypothetical protein
MLSVALRVGFSCPECMGPVPMNGIVSEVLCYHCQAVVSTDKPIFFLQDEFKSGWGDARTWSSRPSRKTGVEDLRVEAALRRPSCNGCRAAFDDASLTAAFQAGTGVTCPCGKVSSVRGADDLVLRVSPRAQAVVGEEIGTDLKLATQPILFSCLQCGAGLPVDGSQRVVACTYCKATSFLPDALWLRLHPTARLLWFYLAIDTA